MTARQPTHPSASRRLGMDSLDRDEVVAFSHRWFAAAILCIAAQPAFAEDAPAQMGPRSADVDANSANVTMPACHDYLAYLSDGVHHGRSNPLSQGYCQGLVVRANLYGNVGRLGMSTYWCDEGPISARGRSIYRRETLANS